MDDNRKQALAAALTQIERQFGKGAIMRMGDGMANREVPVVSTGVSARMNVLGFMILEAYYAYPWQRPDKGWHWGFNMAPGW